MTHEDASSHPHTPFTPGQAEAARALIKKHLSSPDITPEEYLSIKRAELSRSLVGKTLIYLDTCHWINLRHVLLKSPKAVPVYHSVMELLEQLCREGKLVCPVSCASFEELMKQSDPSSRSSTAKLMDSLSCGVCVLNWIHLIILEWEQHIARTLLGLANENSEINPFTKIGFWAGEHVVEYGGMPESDRRVYEKLYIDRRWTMSVTQYQAAPGYSKPPDAFFAQFVADGERRRNIQLSKPSSFADLARRAREASLSFMRGDFSSSMARLCPVKSGDAALANYLACREPLIERPEPWTVPSLQVFAYIDAAATFHRRKILENDMYDFMHAAEAIPYCDAFFCDKPLASFLRSKPLELHAAYSTVIHSRPEDILSYLEGLNL